MTRLELSARGRGYVDSAARFDSMTNHEFVEVLETHGLDVADFQLVLGLNEEVGSRVLPAMSGEAPRVRLGLVGGPVTVGGKPLVPFLESSTGTFRWSLCLDGGVSADSESKAAPPLMLADTFDVLLEGMALEHDAWNRFGRPGNDFYVRRNELESNLPATAQVKAASDSWSTWWAADTFVIRASFEDSHDWVKATVWSDQETPRPHVATIDWLQQLSGTVFFALGQDAR